MSAACHRQRSTRLVVRHVSELLLARGRRWHALVPHDHLGSIVFSTVVSASIAALPLREAASGRWVGVEDAHRLGRPVTCTAIAHSMRLPHTTVRRRAAQLLGDDLLVRSAAGYSIAPAMIVEGRLDRTAAANARDLTHSLAVLADAGYAPAIRASAAGVAALPPGVVERPLIAFSLRALETFTALYGDVTAGTIMSAIIAANVRHITQDAALAGRFAGEAEVPGDDQRRPLTLRALARAVDMPFETVRRRVVALTRQGFVQAVDGGVIVPTRVLAGERHVDNNRRIVACFEQLLDTLVLLAPGAAAAAA